MKKEGKEGGEKIVALPETTSEILGLDNGWLYTGNIDIPISSDEAADDLDDGETVYDDSIHAYALGNYLQDPTFKNAVSDETMSVLENQETIPYPRTINLCWKIVLHDSKLAKMMVDIIALYGHPEDFAATPLVYSMGFVLNLTRACLEESLMVINERLPRYRPKCYYHEHDNDEDKRKEVKLEVS